MKKSLSVVFALGSLILTSCGTTASSVPEGSNSNSHTSDTTTPPSSQTSAPSSDSGDYSKATSEFSLLQDVMANGSGIWSTPSIGDVNLLVLPIDFSDKPSSSLAGGTSESLERINDGFFGERDETDTIESLSSFYKKTSYGKLNISGDVADWYRAPKSVSYYESITDESTQTDLIDDIIAGALSQYDKTHDLNKYDSNKDGLIDGVWLVYSADINYSSDSSMFWAFTYWSGMEQRFENDSLDVQTYAWASYNFFDEGGYQDHPDAHTFIHETGHMLGLQDFYDYNSSQMNFSSPVGGLDMMDCNIGDHHAFSKYSLGWVEPEVLKTSTTITLKPFTTSGDCAIIPATYYNGTSLSEYIILQYYTPDGLNKLDAETSYSGYPNMYNTSGLLMYHADQRIAKIDNNYNIVSMVDDFSNLEWNDRYFYDVANSNTTDRSYQTSKNYHHLVELISAKETFNYDRYGSDADIFQAGSDYGITKNVGAKWYDGGLVGTTIKVDSVTAEGITITVTVA